MARVQNEVRDAILAKMVPIKKPKAKKTTKVEQVVGSIKKIIKKK